jgi:hypothetical protein
VVLGITPFIATIAVPHRKKGAINSKALGKDEVELELSCIEYQDNRIPVYEFTQFSDNL